MASLPSPLLAAPAPPSLIIHLDLNKTVLMSDPAASADSSALLSSVLASCAYGSVSPRGWTLSEPRLLPRPPSASAISYFSYVREVLHPYAPAGSSPDAAARNDAAKAAARALLSAFTSPGSPGAAFAPTLAELLARLALPPGAAVARGAASGLSGLARGEVFLLPAYFRLLRHLRCEQAAPWLLVLRTFGADLPAVVAEHNAWAAGAHPLQAASAGDSALRIDAADVAVVERDSTDADDARLLRTGAPPCRGVLAIHAALAGLVPAPVEMAAATERETPGRVIAWRDAHWRLWFDHGERAAAGKLVPIAPGESVFVFDDNIGGEADTLRLLAETHVAGLPIATDADAADSGEAKGDAGIIDARDARDGSPIAFAHTRNVHLARVCPLAAILNEDYLVELLRVCQGNLAARSSASK